MSDDTYLKPDTVALANEVQTAVQDGHARATGCRTIRKEKREVEQASGPGQAMDDTLEHPLLPKMEGDDPDVSPVIALSSEENKEAYYEELELQMEKRNELKQRLAKEQAPTFNPRPGA